MREREREGDWSRASIRIVPLSPERKVSSTTHSVLGQTLLKETIHAYVVLFTERVEHRICQSALAPAFNVQHGSACVRELSASNPCLPAGQQSHCSRERMRQDKLMPGGALARERGSSVRGFHRTTTGPLRRLQHCPPPTACVVRPCEATPPAPAGGDGGGFHNIYLLCASIKIEPEKE